MKKTALALLAVSVAGSAHASDVKDTISGPFAFTYIALGAGIPWLRDGDLGKDHTFRSVDSLIVTLALTEGLKSVVHERRPDGSDHESFPSGHASLSFAVATMESQFHPKESVFWYAGAALISASRVEERKHYVHDVVAGAALGYLVSRAELSLPHGMILQPLIGRGGFNGVMLTKNF